MDWDDLRIFLATARGGGLSAAARRLRVDPATVSRRIARLEDSLGAALFLKSQQGYLLTEAGQGLLSHAEAVEAEVAGGLARVRGGADALSGTVRIGAPDGVANYILPQIATAIMQAHATLDIQIVALPRIFNLSQREVDLAITVSPPKAGRVLVQKLCDYSLSLVAHPDYLDRAPALNATEDLSQHRLIGYIPDLIYDTELDFLTQLGAAPTLTSNSASVQLNLLSAGAGIGVAHDFALPSAPRLRRLLPGEVRFTRAYHLLRPREEARAARSQRIAELLVQGVRAEVARLETLARDP